jgi:RNA polymerase primary sigma factor
MAGERAERPIGAPDHMIEVINRVVRTSRQMLPEIGREPTPEELAEKLGIPLYKLRRVLEVARRPIALDTKVADNNTG